MISEHPTLGRYSVEGDSLFKIVSNILNAPPYESNIEKLFMHSLTLHTELPTRPVKDVVFYSPCACVSKSEDPTSKRTYGKCTISRIYSYCPYEHGNQAATIWLGYSGSAQRVHICSYLRNNLLLVTPAEYDFLIAWERNSGVETKATISTQELVQLNKTRASCARCSFPLVEIPLCLSVINYCRKCCG